MGKLKTALKAAADAAVKLEATMATLAADLERRNTSVSQVFETLLASYDQVYMTLTAECKVRKEDINNYRGNSLKSVLETFPKSADYWKKIPQLWGECKKQIKIRDGLQATFDKADEGVKALSKHSDDIEKMIGRRAKSILRSSAYKAKLPEYLKELGKLDSTIATLEKSFKTRAKDLSDGTAAGMAAIDKRKPESLKTVGDLYNLTTAEAKQAADILRQLDTEAKAAKREFRTGGLESWARFAFKEAKEADAFEKDTEG